MTVPAEALTAITRIAQESEPAAAATLNQRPGQMLAVLLDVARRSAEAAAPLIEAAERDRIRQLALAESARHAMTVPPDARTAAAIAIHDADCPHICSGSVTGHCHKLAEDALEAAAPLIAAAERDRIRRDLILGDPGKLEAAFRRVLDDEEAADCALIVADLLGGAS